MSLAPLMAQDALDVGLDEDTGGQTEQEGFDGSQFTLSIKDWNDNYPSVALAIESLQKNNVPEATKLFLDAVADNPELPQAEVLMAEYYFALNKNPSGYASLEQAIKNFPDDPEPYLVLGNVAFNQKRYVDSRLLFEKAASLYEGYDAADKKKRRLALGMYAGLSLVEERAEAWKKMIPHLRNWLKVDPKNPAAHLRLARALFHSEQGKAAYAQAQKPSQLNPNFAKAELLIARFYKEAGEEETAARWRAAAEKKYPDDHTTRLILADQAWANGDLEGASKHALKAVEIDKSSKAALVLAGMAAHAGGDYARAEDLLRQAKELAPNDFLARNHLAMVLAAQEGEKANEALTIAQQNRQDFPNSHLAVATLGFAQFQLGQREEAAKLYKVAVNAGPGTGDMVYFLARYWEEEENTSEALRLLSAVMGNKTNFVFRRDAEALFDRLKSSQPDPGDDDELGLDDLELP